MSYIIAIDQGTTSSRAILFNDQQEIVGMRQKETKQFYPNPGWVEQDPQDIWATSYGVLQEVIAVTGVDPKEICALGITNQRETTVVWERATGKPLHPAIVWQCRRTADTCEAMKVAGWTDHILAKTGLVIDAYFSATKLAYILDRVDPDRSRAKAGEILFGTVDSWLLWKLTDGAVHATDYTNASRTMLYNIHTLDWDDEILAYFDIPRSMLPAVHPSGYRYGTLELAGDVHIPIAGIAGDQQAALYGQGCFNAGEAKNTYGTGCFLLMNIGNIPIQSKHGLVTTIAAGLNAKPAYALEGSIFVGGAVIQWLRDELRFIEDAPDSEFFAEKIKDNGGVYLVPAFVGLGAPHWDMYARGALYGLTRGTGRPHIIRAALESIAYQTVDVLNAMVADSGINIERLKADGGAAANNFLMQFQADILNTGVDRPAVLETTALGAATLAGLTTNVWESEAALKENLTIERQFEPRMPKEVRESHLKGWNEAMERTKTK